jgi:cell division septum initiation protein DivIVA
MGLAEQIGQLEAAVDAGWRVPGTRYRLVDRTLLLELIDQIRVSIPEHMRAAQQQLQHRDRVLASARAEADAVLAEAHRQAQRRSTDRATERAAATRAAQIEQQARRTAEGIERQAEQAAVQRLRSLRARLDEVDQVLAQWLPSPARVNEPRGHVAAGTSSGKLATGARRRWAA